MTTQVWSEHLVDIVRAVEIIEDADKALGRAISAGNPGHLSDLEFNLPKRVPITIDGTDTGRAIVWSEDMEVWAAEFGEVEK